MKSSDTGNIAELIEMLRQDAVEKYKEEHGWIPITERMPGCRCRNRIRRKQNDK